ncbi:MULTISPECIES: cupin domain-containing protein [Streptomycetaceae]|uniref:Cupin 2 domain-containing protein n=1 Tax=Streptantibioticus cattleyicolor (strain ATCC 35852 / DSM 46488 / JCM 4925 / NBRC 14057 / NRRL 8057) TaxID=1003195 RepID=F8JS41_STREN|nr:MULTISPECIES: cupin domain-containing protein [Streptomycetaceae]AEW94152.1 cupin 2 domain-containing protein [Streptantibioticus cattleyicolor NRRL 8057 = DSM 46488]MYS58816.1 cupin domain-containing protein [Streptomyces sp. SID5468]CCB74505.1 Cupin 2 conserved barrel domain protein [Streptantibioticus cattleyicolor NRRL 8057 = DSM 46488]
MSADVSLQQPSDAAADRFVVLGAGENRPTRVPLPPGFGVKVATGDSEGRLAVLENRLDVDIPMHVHEVMDEFVYVLDGEMEVDFEGETYRLTQGMCALLPHGVPHAMRNASQPPARALQVSTPGGWDRFMEDLFAAGSDVRTPEGAMDLAKVNGIGEKYGMRYTGGTMDLGRAPSREG